MAITFEGEGAGARVPAGQPDALRWEVDGQPARPVPESPADDSWSWLFASTADGRHELRLVAGEAGAVVDALNVLGGESAGRGAAVPAALLVLSCVLAFLLVRDVLDALRRVPE
jgi:hypothetical protein